MYQKDETETLTAYYLGGGIIYTLPAHIDKDKPLVLRKWKRELQS